MKHLREVDLLDPLILSPKHLLKVLLPHTGPVHGQEADETGKANLNKVNCHSSKLLIFDV